LEKASPLPVEPTFNRTRWCLQDLVPKWGFVLKTALQVLTRIQPPHGVVVGEQTLESIRTNCEFVTETNRQTNVLLWNRTSLYK